MSLMTLPILPLELIVSYLDFSSLLSLANSHPSFAHLHPKEQLVIGEDFSVAGIRWQIRGLEHNPQHYLDVKIETRGLLGIKMVWEWITLIDHPGQDSIGAQLWLQLVRKDKVCLSLQVQ